MICLEFDVDKDNFKSRNLLAYCQAPVRVLLRAPFPSSLISPISVDISLPHKQPKGAC